jgi:hypothetical protein
VDGERYIFEVHQHLDQHHVRVLTLHVTAGFMRGVNVPGKADIRKVSVFPPVRERKGAPGTGNPPYLYLKPAEFLRELLQHHMYATFRAVFLDSLLAENEVRMLHLENAVRHLGEQNASLSVVSETYF